MIEVLSIRLLLFFLLRKRSKSSSEVIETRFLRSPTDWARRRLSIFPLVVVRDLFAFCHSCYLTVSFTFFFVTMMNFTTGANTSELLSLDRIRSQLIRLEDTIIFCQ